MTSVSIEWVFGCQKVNHARSGWPTSIISIANRPAVTDEAHDHGGVQDRLQLGALQDVNQKSGEKRTRAQRNDRQIAEKSTGRRRSGCPCWSGSTRNTGKARPHRPPSASTTAQGASQSRNCESEVRSAPRAIHRLSANSGRLAMFHLRAGARTSTPPALSPMPPSTCNKPSARCPGVPATGMLRGNALAAKTGSFGSARLPNRIAPVGQASTQAGM